MLERIDTPGALPAQVGHEDVAQLLQENCDQEQHTLQGGEERYPADRHEHDRSGLLERQERGARVDTGRPAERQARKPPITSVASASAKRAIVAAARLDW